jgi:hypothetical protein
MCRFWCTVQKKPASDAYFQANKLLTSATKGQWLVSPSIAVITASSSKKENIE